MNRSGLNQQKLQTLNPYSSLGKESGLESRSQTMLKYTDLESKAEMMNIINNGRLNKIRQGGIPQKVLDNKNHVFGTSSVIETNMS